jgi:aerobic carbon-monoxide dehydrogenase large subunit
MRSRSTGWSRSTPTRTCRERLREPLPLLIPHPTLTAADPAPARQRRGQPRRRGHRHGRRHGPLRRRGRLERIAVDYDPLPAVVGPVRRGSARTRRPRRHSPTTSRPHDDADHRRRRRRDRRCAAHACARARHRTLRVDAAGGPWRVRPVGHRRPSAAGLLVDPGPDERPRRDRDAARPAIRATSSASPRTSVAGFGVKIVHPWPEEVLVPWAAHATRARRQVRRGPTRALRLRHPRACAGPRRRGRLRRRRAGSSG